MAEHDPQVSWDVNQRVLLCRPPGLVFTINYGESWKADSRKGDLNFIITVLRFQDIFLYVFLHAIVARYGIEE